MTLTRIIYYQIRFRADSPLSVGSGHDDRTDSDIIRDSRGKAYIPGSSLAGAAASLWPRSDDPDTGGYYRDLFNIVFGFVKNDGKNPDGTKNGEEQSGSSILTFYDAELEKKSPVNISIRDSVALDRYRTSVPGAKFDREVLETGADFVTYIELRLNENTEKYRQELENFLRDIWMNKKSA